MFAIVRARLPMLQPWTMGTDDDLPDATDFHPFDSVF